FLSQRWERNQRIAGGRLRMDTACPYSPFPRTPVTGVTPCSGQNISGAQNQECLGAGPSGPLGPGFTKIRTSAVPHLRLSLPSQRSQPDSRRRGGLWPPESLPL